MVDELDSMSVVVVVVVVVVVLAVAGLVDPFWTGFLGSKSLRCFCHRRARHSA